MAETESPQAHSEPPPASGRRDVRVVTPDQLVELRREQREIYRSLRQKGFGPSQAAREIGIPSSLADQWEGAATAAPAADRTAPAGPTGATGPACPGGSPLPAPDSNEPRAAEIRRLAGVYREACEVARQARACAERLEREIALLREHLQRLEAAADSAPPLSATRSVPSRAARSSLTTVLLARGRAREHPAPAPRA